MIKNLPTPCPVLQKGQALGSSHHVGFVAVWNWIIDFFQNIKTYIPVGINNRTGNVYVVAGKGIDVKTSGKTITISLGEGNTEDDGSGDDGSGSGDDGSGSGNGSGDGDGDWYPPESLDDDGGLSKLGGSGGGMFKWDEETQTIGPGGCMFGRQWVTATGTGSGKADGFYSLRCSIANSGSTACAVVSDATLGQAPTTQYSWIPIYQITDGKIATDYRGAFVVPCYE